MQKYLIVIEKSSTGYSAYSPDVLGCIATGKTIEKTITNMQAALAMHLHSLIEDGEAIPEPRGVAAYLDAVSDSAGEEYLLTHIAVDSVLPDRAPA